MITRHRTIRTFPRRGAGRGVFFSIAIVLVGAAGIGFWWFFGDSALRNALQRGLILLSRADSRAAESLALENWAAETAAAWRGRPLALAEFARARFPLTDTRIRMLVSYVAGVDYGDREKDWKRWAKYREAAERGREPESPASERVQLDLLWNADVGPTQWYATILPIDGKIYVPTTGKEFEGAEDAYDGVVLVDGKTGSANLIFQSPDRHPRDVMGIAAGDEMIFAACRNGLVYGLSPNGVQRWRASAGGTVATVPVAFDANGDGRTDVAVMTTNGHATTLNGESGRPIWNAALEIAPKSVDEFPLFASPEQAALAGAFSVGAAPGGRGTALYATTSGGNVYCLTPNRGTALWSGRVGRTIAGGLMLVPREGDAASGLYVGDGSGGVLSFLHAGRDARVAELWRLQTQWNDGLAAPIRTISIPGTTGQAIVACTLGHPEAISTPGEGHATVSLLNERGVEWRFPVDGVIRGAPAVADINADRRPEIIVATSLLQPTNEVGGFLYVISSEGHCLRRLPLEHGVSSSPVVADVDGDGRLEVLVVLRSGRMRCYTVGKYGPVQWGLFAGDIRNSNNAADAFTYSQTPAGFQWKWSPSRPTR
ncbi:MAG: hypothetical protein AMXMBFR47_29010 [Planctomycetota bacterium]